MTLLDTHVLLWLDTGSDRLGSGSRGVIDHALRAGELAVSAISFWEVAMLVSKGRVRMEMAPDAWRGALLEAGLTELPVDGRTGIRAAQLDDFHGDTADRLNVATAQAHAALLCTADRRILDWRGDVRRQCANL
ncbi:MAG: type II toxin-antitoxin system VapC family toxin [Gammaproteobacteria bacterium]